MHGEKLPEIAARDIAEAAETTLNAVEKCHSIRLALKWDAVRDAWREAADRLAGRPGSIPSLPWHKVPDDPLNDTPLEDEVPSGDTVFTFGEHQGRTFAEVKASEPEYVSKVLEAANRQYASLGL